MYIIGITGGTGAGKTLALASLKEFDALLLDCDQIYHDLLQSNIEMKVELESHFTDITTDGKIDRKKLSKIVWQDPQALLKLNEITHKHVTDDINIKIENFEKNGGKYAAIDAIALIESGISGICDIVVGVIAPEEIRKKRIMKRDNIPENQALSRIKAQQSDGYYQKNCNDILENKFETPEEFVEECKKYFEKLIGGKQPMESREKAKINEWFENQTESFISDLGRVVEVKSIRGETKPGAPYGAESREVLTLTQKMLEERGFEVNVFEDMINTVDFGPAPPTLGILAHLDIVAEGDGWETDPYKMERKAGKLYGRGVLDNKGPSVAAMYALYCVKELFPELKKGVRIILGSGEEVGFDDVKQYVKKNETPRYVFTPDAEYPVVNTEKGRFLPVFGAKWEKDNALPRIISITGGKTPNVVPNRSEAEIEGISLSDVEAFCREFTDKTKVKMTATEASGVVTVNAEGEATHASIPERGNNAQTALVEMLAAMPFAGSEGFGYIKALNRLFPHGDYHGKAIGIDMSDEITGQITVNFGVLRYDEYEFSGNFDSRTPSCADDADLFGITKAAFENEKISITYHEISQAHHTPEDSPFVQKLLNIYEEYTGKPGDCLSMGGQTYVHGIKGGVAFGCAMPGDNNNVHGANEYVEIKQLIDSAKMFTQAIVDICL